MGKGTLNGYRTHKSIMMSAWLRITMVLLEITYNSIEAVIVHASKKGGLSVRLIQQQGSDGSPLFQLIKENGHKSSAYRRGPNKRYTENSLLVILKSPTVTV